MTKNVAFFPFFSVNKGFLGIGFYSGSNIIFLGSLAIFRKEEILYLPDLTRLPLLYNKPGKREIFFLRNRTRLIRWTVWLTGCVVWTIDSWHSCRSWLPGSLVSFCWWPSILFQYQVYIRYIDFLLRSSTDEIPSNVEVSVSSCLS